jgi:large subunit ribosomal protein L5
MAKQKDDKQEGKKQDAKAKPQAEKAAAPKQAQAKPQGKKDVAKAAPVEKADAPKIPAPPARLATYYKDKVVPELTQKFGYKSPMEVPRLKKITLNMGVGETTSDKKVLDNAVADMAKIAGQKPVVTKSRKSIANFKVRANFPVGCMVTLRGARMYEFLDRLVNIAIPRIRDFRGVSNRAFDGRGNYSLGVKEQIIFPEIEYDKIDALRGMDIAINTTAKTDEEARALLAAFRFPFRQQA